MVASSPDKLMIKSKDCRVQLTMNVYLQNLRPMFQSSNHYNRWENCFRQRKVTCSFLSFCFAATASFGDCDKQLKSNC